MGAGSMTRVPGSTCSQSRDPATGPGRSAVERGQGRLERCLQGLRTEIPCARVDLATRPDLERLCSQRAVVQYFTLRIFLHRHAAKLLHELTAIQSCCLYCGGTVLLSLAINQTCAHAFRDMVNHLCARDNCSKETFFVQPTRGNMQVSRIGRLQPSMSALLANHVMVVSLKVL
jgi:hypothetical protein